MDVPDRYDPTRIAANLGACRHRGLDFLDHRSANQEAVRADELQRLAEEYAAVCQFADGTRGAQIKALLIAGIEDLRRQQRHSDADLIRDLFFGESTHGPIRPSGELLKTARLRVGDTTDARFRTRRRNAMRSFAHVLVSLVEAPRAEPAPASPGVAPAADVHEPDEQRVTVDSAAKAEHFIALLAAAQKATIIGITNEHLLDTLKDALRLKRLTSGRPDDFWESLRIVFLSKDLLASVNDERARLHDAADALHQRRQAAIWARRLISVFLKRTMASSWALYECSYQPGVTGSLAEFPDRSQKAHLLIRRPQRPTADHVAVDIEGSVGRLGEVFDEIVHTSESDTMIVPVGAPAGRAFRCNTTRVQSDVLKDGSKVGGWLPMVLIITYQHRRGRLVPLVQLRTIENSAREENRLSHLGGHIVQEDRLRPGGHELAAPVQVFDLEHEIPRCAAARIVQEVTGTELRADLIPMTTGGYLYPDKESLFFFVYAVELQEGAQLQREAEMTNFDLPELLAVRSNQVLRFAAALCRSAGIDDDSWADAARIVALNLCLHGLADLGDKLPGLIGRSSGEREELATAALRLVRDRTAPTRASDGRVTLQGLAGWQYRQFFSDLIPLYERLGIDGAAELCSAIGDDPGKSRALAELSELYQDERLMASLPMEL